MNAEEGLGENVASESDEDKKKRKSKKRISCVWSHFETLESENKCICKLCPASMPRISAHAANLKRHLKRHHSKASIAVEAGDRETENERAHKRTNFGVTSSKPQKPPTRSKPAPKEKQRPRTPEDFGEASYEEYETGKTVVKDEIMDEDEYEIKEQHDEFAKVFLNTTGLQLTSSSSDDDRSLNPYDGTLKQKRKSSQQKFQTYVRREFRKLENQINMTQHNQLLFQRSVDTKLNYLESLLKTVIKNPSATKNRR